MNGEKARLLREASGLSQHEVSRRTGVHYSIISRMESDKGRPGVDGLVALARCYGVVVEQLLGYDLEERQFQSAMIEWNTRQRVGQLITGRRGRGNRE